MFIYIFDVICLQLSICEDLLQEPDVETAIRLGDCLAMLVEHYYKRRKFAESYRYMQIMQSRNIVLHPYLRDNIIEEVCKAVGVPVDRGGAKEKKGGAGGGDVDLDEDADAVGEELDEVDTIWIDNHVCYIVSQLALRRWKKKLKIEKRMLKKRRRKKKKRISGHQQGEELVMEAENNLSCRA